jgi:hypothetical protein
LKNAELAAKLHWTVNFLPLAVNQFISLFMKLLSGNLSLSATNAFNTLVWLLTGPNRLHICDNRLTG